MAEKKVDYDNLIEQSKNFDGDLMRNKIDEVCDLKIGGNNCLLNAVGENGVSEDEMIQAQELLLETVTGNKDITPEILAEILNDPTAPEDLKKQAGEQYVILTTSLSRALNHLGDEDLGLGDVKGVEEKFKGTKFEGIGEAVVADTYRDENIRPFVAKVNTLINFNETGSEAMGEKLKRLNKAWLALEDNENIDPEQKEMLMAHLNEYNGQLFERIKNEKELEMAEKTGKTSGAKVDKNGKKEGEDGYSPDAEEDVTAPSPDGKGPGKHETKNAGRPWELKQTALIQAITEGERPEYRRQTPPEWVSLMDQEIPGEKKSIEACAVIGQRASQKQSCGSLEEWGKGQATIPVYSNDMLRLYEEQSTENATRQAMEQFVQDLCVLKDVRNGPEIPGKETEYLELLELRTMDRVKDDLGGIADWTGVPKEYRAQEPSRRASKFFADKERYVEIMAIRIENGTIGLRNSNDEIEPRIDASGNKWYLDRQGREIPESVFLEIKALDDKAEKEAEARVKEGKLANDRIRLRTTTAWAFLFGGDLLEAADTTRQKKEAPKGIKKDVIGKSGLCRRAGILSKLFVSREKWLQSIALAEQSSGNIGKWLLDKTWHDSKRKTDPENSFARKIQQGEIPSMPEHVGLGFFGRYMVKVKDGGGTVNMSIGKALCEGRDIMFADNQDNLYIKQKELYDGIMDFNALLDGQVQISGKDGGMDKFIDKIRNGVAMFLQVDDLVNSRGEKTHLKMANDPHFFIPMVVNSLQIDTESQGFFRIQEEKVHQLIHDLKIAMFDTRGVLEADMDFDHEVVTKEFFKWFGVAENEIAFGKTTGNDFREIVNTRREKNRRQDELNRIRAENRRNRII